MNVLVLYKHVDLRSDRLLSNMGEIANPGTMITNFVFWCLLVLKVFQSLLPYELSRKI